MNKTQLKKAIARDYNERYVANQEAQEAVVAKAALVESVELTQADINAVVGDSKAIVTNEYQEPEQPKLTPDEFAKRMGWSKIPKFKVSPKTYQLRKMFKQLTKEEMHYDAVKRPKVEAGTNKIFNLLSRAGI